jgi:predicted RNase H-like HicB family nuclease
MSKQTIHVVLYKSGEGDQWLATCLDYGVTTQGDSAEHAAEMIKEAVELYLEDREPREIEAIHQPIEGDPIVRRVAIDAAPVLHG